MGKEDYPCLQIMKKGSVVKHTCKIFNEVSLCSLNLTGELQADTTELIDLIATASSFHSSLHPLYFSTSRLYMMICLSTQLLHDLFYRGKCVCVCFNHSRG